MRDGQRQSGQVLFQLFYRSGNIPEGVKVRKQISWTEKGDDGVKTEVRVQVVAGRMKWQYKRYDAEAWDYDRKPSPADWNKLEDILERRAGRGRGTRQLEIIRKERTLAEG